MWKTRIPSPLAEWRAYANQKGLCGLLWPESDATRFRKTEGGKTEGLAVAFLQEAILEGWKTSGLVSLAIWNCAD